MSVRHEFNKKEVILNDKRSDREREFDALGSNERGLPLPCFPLSREPGVPSPFPFDALGHTLGGVARRLHEVIKAPDAICENSVLAVAGLVVQAHGNVSIHGRSYPLSLFLISMGESGDRKSAVDNVVLKPIRDYEKMLLTSNKEEQRRYRDAFDVWKK